MDDRKKELLADYCEQRRRACCDSTLPDSERMAARDNMIADALEIADEEAHNQR